MMSACPFHPDMAASDRQPANQPHHSANADLVRLERIGLRRLARWRLPAARLTGLTAQDINRVQRTLRREHDAVGVIDYFPTESATWAGTAWMDFIYPAATLLSPGKPHAVDAAMARCASTVCQGRTRAARRRPWVDRVASAWLIGATLRRTY